MPVTEIEIPMDNLPNEPKKSSTASAILTLAKKGGQELGKGVVHGAKTLVVSEAMSFICANATYDLLMTIFEGYPTLAPELAREFAKWQIPAVAIPVVIIAALRQIKFGSEEPFRLVNAFMNGLGITAFTIPMAMEMVTRAVQIIKDESRSTPVWITDWEADVIIAGCGFVGLWQAIQTYYQKINEELPERQRSLLNRLSTNQFMVVVFAILNSASAFHAATFQMMQLLRLDTASLVNYYTRLGITVGAGAVGGVILGRPNPEERWDAKGFNLIANVLKLFALVTPFIEMFYLSPKSEELFGEVADEQTWLWTVVIPAIPAIILMLQLAGVQGPKLYKALAELMQNCLENSDELTEETSMMNSTNINALVRYSAINSSPKDDDDSISNIFEDDFEPENGPQHDSNSDFVI